MGLGAQTGTDNVIIAGLEQPGTNWPVAIAVCVVVCCRSKD